MKYNNKDDHDEFINSLYNTFKKTKLSDKISNRMNDIKDLDDPEDIWNTLFGKNRDTELDPNCKTIAELLNQLIFGIKNTKGQSTIFLSDDDLTLELSIASYALNSNDIFEINLNTSSGSEIPVKNIVKDIKTSMSKYRIDGHTPFVFKFRGVSLKVESIQLIMHEDDDDSTFSIIFNQDIIQKAKKTY